MERINIPASLQNLSQVGKVQQSQHSAPMVQAIQNSEIDRNQQDEKTQKPNEVDESENPVIDPDEKKEQPKQEQKKKKKKQKPGRENRGPASGKFVDYSA